MLITPTGCSADTLTADELVEMSFNGRWHGTIKPSSEWELHAAIYLEAPEARVIIHTHSDHATALACLNRPLPAFHYNVAEFGGDDVRCAPYATFGTPKLASLAARAIRGRSACLLANHGMIVHGSTIEAALSNAIRLEALCKQYLLALASGTPRLLSQAEIRIAIAQYDNYGQQQE
jgi:L-fuculose-phosphate aldolase